jgi:hypothetical protein
VLVDDLRSDFAALLTKRGGFMVSLIAFELLRKTPALETPRAAQVVGSGQSNMSPD